MLSRRKQRQREAMQLAQDPHQEAVKPDMWVSDCLNSFMPSWWGWEETGAGHSRRGGPHACLCVGREDQQVCHVARARRGGARHGSRC